MGRTTRVGAGIGLVLGLAAATAGCSNGAGGGTAGVVINEVVHKALPAGAPDWIEFYNRGDDAVDLSGWTVMDDKDTHAWHFPAGTSIGPGAFLVVQGETGTGPYVLPFGFGSTDSANLADPAGVQVDHTSWVKPAAPAGTSWGRYPDGDGPFATLSSPTPGEPNAQPL